MYVRSGFPEFREWNVMRRVRVVGNGEERVHMFPD
jgi:hypothetical protein